MTETRPQWQPNEWRKGSRSAQQNCIEVQYDDTTVQLRDTNQPGFVLTVSRADFDVFRSAVVAGEFDIA